MDSASRKRDDDRATAGPMCRACRGCSAGMSVDDVPDGAPAGGALVARAAGAFVVPIVGALAGVALAGGNETRRFVGLALGLLAGLLVSVLGARLIGRRGGVKEPR